MFVDTCPSVYRLADTLWMDSFLGNCLRDHWDQRRGRNSQVHARQRLVKFRAATASLRAHFGASAIANFLLSVSDRERLNMTVSLIEFQSNWLANPPLVDMFVAPIPCSSMVERAAVNRQVTGSSPVGGVAKAGWPRAANPLVHWCGVARHRS